MTDIPKKQKAAVYDKPGTVSTKVTEIDVPEPGQGEVLINLYVNKPYPEQPAKSIIEPIRAFVTPTLES